MEKPVLDALSPYIAALPTGTRINVNTAPAAVLRSLDDSISDGDVARLEEERAGGGFADIINTFSPFASIDVNALEDSSEYFRLLVVVRIDTVRVTFFSVLKRDANGSVVPLVRSLGTF